MAHPTRRYQYANMSQPRSTYFGYDNLEIFRAAVSQESARPLAVLAGEHSIEIQNLPFGSWRVSIERVEEDICKLQMHWL